METGYGSLVKRYVSRCLSRISHLLLNKIMPFWQKYNLPNYITYVIDAPSMRIILFPVCYTTCPKHLTNAMREIFMRAISWQKQLRFAETVHILVSTYDVLTETERAFKEDLLRFYRVDDSSVIWTEPIANSADEARKGARAVAENNIKPNVVIMITAPMNTRTALIVGEHEFPKSKVLIDCIDVEQWEDETQSDHIVTVQRSPWAWLVMNVLRWVVLCFPGGFEFVAWQHHRIVKNI